MTEERRLVTILFADVTGSTALGESMDPEDVRALLGRYYAIAKDVVSAHGGTVEKFIGDAVMAVFGLPIAHGDDAERELAAALELRDRVKDEPKLGESIPVRIGVNTGEVVAPRDMTGGDFLVTGDAVNVAARLQQAAEPWQIMSGERSVLAADRAFAFGPFTVLEAKGKRAGVRAAPLLHRSTGPRRISVPLIGRTGELAQLELAAGRALRDRRPARSRGSSVSAFEIQSPKNSSGALAATDGSAQPACCEAVLQRRRRFVCAVTLRPQPPDKEGRVRFH